MDLKTILEEFGTHLTEVLTNLQKSIHNNIHTAAYDDANTTKKAVGARDILIDVIGALPKVVEEYIAKKEAPVSSDAPSSVEAAE